MWELYFKLLKISISHQIELIETHLFSQLTVKKVNFYSNVLLEFHWYFVDCSLGYRKTDCTIR